MTKRIALLVLVLTAACGTSHGASPVAGPATQAPVTAATHAPAAPAVLHVTSPATKPATKPAAKPVAPTAPGVHFRTPEAAMRYMAKAWNDGSMARLKRVTDPNARQLLLDMHREATNLTLKSCSFNKDRGDYDCLFTHDYPTGYTHSNPIGYFEAQVGPASKPGWYMTYYESCG